MADITQTISGYTGEKPNDSTMQFSEFADAAFDLVSYWQGVPSEMNQWAAQANELSSQVHGQRAAVLGFNSEINMLFADIQDVSSVISASANNKGPWSSLSGAAAPFYMVEHRGSYWELLSAVSNVAAHEPSDGSAYWKQVRMQPSVRRPLPVTPTNGSVHVARQVTLQASEYSNIYNSDTRLYRHFEIDTENGDWSSPIYAFDGDTDAHQIPIQVAALSVFKWRCKDVAHSGEASDWSFPQFFVTTE